MFTKRWRAGGCFMSVQRTLCTLVVLNVAMFVTMSICLMFGRFHLYLPTLTGNDCNKLSTLSFTDKYFTVETPGAEINLATSTWSKIEANLTMVHYGGRYKPRDSRPVHNITVVVPYRDRLLHLKLFLAHIHPFLQRQNLEYVIYVVKMEPEGMFKKTVIMNAAFLEVSRRENTSCIVFHDVDMLPLDDENLYYCRPDVVRHLATAVKQFNYTLPYWGYIGGVIAFPPTLYRRVNGFSNLYSGWGGEDDDLYLRIRSKGIPIERPPLAIGRYKSWSHTRQPMLENRVDYILKSVERMEEDGLNSVDYRLVRFEEKPLYTWMVIKTNNSINAYQNLTPKYV